MTEQSVKNTPQHETQSKPKQKTVKLIIKRQDTSDSKPYEETFEIPYRENLNVIACLMEIRRNPVNIKGEKNNACCLGYELLRRSMWSMFYGYQWSCKTILFCDC